MTVLTNVRAALLVEEREPPLMASVPVPKEASLPAWIRPSVRVVPPVNVLAAESTKVPVVVLVSAPLPSRIASIVPDWTAAEVMTRAPLVTVPPLSERPPMVSDVVPRLRVAPLIVTAPVSARWLPAPLRRRVPASIVVPPV